MKACIRDVEDSSLAAIYCSDFSAHAGGAAIRNVRTRMAVLDVDGFSMPMTINTGGETAESGEENSYVVSPLAAYGSYASAELQRLKKPWLTWPLVLLTKAMRGVLRRARIDAIVQVNNWLLSTNVYPDTWRAESIGSMTQSLAAAFPDCAIGFRSLNEVSHAALIRTLEHAGYVKVPSRQVYLFDARGPEAPAFIRRSDNKRDAALLEKRSYVQVPGAEFLSADFARAEELYNLLYLDKYCRLNPQFTAAWFEAGQQHGWLELTGLRNAAGVLEGIVGWFALDGTLTTPVIGYNTALPASEGLYRQLTQLTLQRAVAAQVLLNRSSGAAGFKRARGGEPAIEYSLVYTRHLSLARRSVWWCLSRLLLLIGVPLIRLLKL